MWYILAFLTFVLFLASWHGGQSNSPSGNTIPQNCDECKRDFSWYNSLRPIKKVQYAVWWAAKKIACAAKGC